MEEIENQALSFYETLHEYSKESSNGIMTFRIGGESPLCGFYIGRFQDLEDLKSYLIRRRLIPFVGETYGMVGDKVWVLSRNFHNLKVVKKKNLEPVREEPQYYEEVPSIHVSTANVDGDLYD